MKTYDVRGPFPFRGNAPGSTFRAEPDPVIERALNRGSIAEVSEKTSPPATTTPTPATPTRHADPKSKEDTK